MNTLVQIDGDDELVCAEVKGKGFVKLDISLSRMNARNWLDGSRVHPCFWIIYSKGVIIKVKIAMLFIAFWEEKRMFEEATFIT